MTVILVKELKAYKYNDKAACYERTVYQKGEVFHLYETDMQHLIYFKTENGDKGYINVTKDDYESTAGEFYIEEERLLIILIERKYHGRDNIDIVS